MYKRLMVIIPGLAFVVAILLEDFSWVGILIALVVSTIAVLFTTRFLPPQTIKNVNFFQLITFPFYLIGQIYLSGLHVMKVVLKGPKVDIVTVKTQITAELLRVILVDSITLTPGSILLDLHDDEVTLLWLHDRDSSTSAEVADKMLKQKLERRLKRAQKSDGDAA
ncbi:MAG: Na+/H+ antiporter subunit E [Defluviitaleaceae bacterium]|nr:Na+/H+ antiporter subunit E [Defluviitaleaceae bacterium]